MDPHAEYRTVEGRGALVFRREMHVAPARAWTALSTPDGLAAWFPCRVDGDPTAVGSTLDFVFPEEGPGPPPTARC